MGFFLKFRYSAVLALFVHTICIYIKYCKMNITMSCRSPTPYICTDYFFLVIRTFYTLFRTFKCAIQYYLSHHAMHYIPMTYNWKFVTFDSFNLICQTPSSCLWPYLFYPCMNFFSLSFFFEKFHI